MSSDILRKPETRPWCREFVHNCPELWWSYQQLKTRSSALKCRSTVPALATTNTVLSHERLCLDCNKTSFVWVALLTLLNSTSSWWLVGKHQCAWDGGLNKLAGQAVYWRLFGRYLVYGWRGLSCRLRPETFSHNCALCSYFWFYVLCFIAGEERLYRLCCLLLFL